MQIRQLDHLVLTVKDLNKTVHFYKSVLGMEKIVYGQHRIALKFGNQKINLHQTGREFEPKAANPAPGSADLCFLTDLPLEQAMNEMTGHGVEIIGGPVERTGANGPIISFYIRDPDQNLIEIANEKLPAKMTKDDEPMNNAHNPLQTVPGIGPAIAAKLNWLGIMEPQELCGQDPQELYDRYQNLVGHPVDRCLLYVFRCAVYFCETENPDPELLKWWNWKGN